MSHPYPPTRVVIAGGGTAGWLAATALVRQLGPLVDVTLVESDEIGIVGVGESTIPTARSFHAFLGIDEAAFMKATQATFKLGIAFENWGPDGARYFHPFGTVGRSVAIADFQHFWLEARRHGFGGAYTDYSLEARAAEAGRFGRDEAGTLAYAYHLDATAYARFLRGIAEPAGVRRVEGRIARIERDGEGGDIAALHLVSGERVEGDLFLDCTGFRALLIEGALETGFEDWSEWLACDRALAVQTEAVSSPVPYTRAIAHRAGWRWRIPLQTRVGNGLVYSSADMSDDEATATLLGGIEGTPLFEPRALQFRAGMRRQAWSANCVALGLAAGFIEPLESTSIHLVMIAVMRLIQGFPFQGQDSAALRARFNAQSRHEWEHIRDFIILHYAQTGRTDSVFWQRRSTMSVPETLAQRIALFIESAGAWQGQDDLFKIDSWVSVMLGQGLFPKSHHRIPSMLSRQALNDSLAGLDQQLSRQVQTIPDHLTFIKGYCGTVAPPDVRHDTARGAL
ncbi:tryptophan halogenase family protein [Sphingomonas sp. SORGH_AS_0879]|uniref:tryptophan halogenase family protein n=1 Tax=Sphingomonas sp. SORGH_AS_0879 TaxID=3041790 RepID=UPI002782C4EA|nr:tryptophan halogenase family protein [Sphingomonas sp. SORGH_AS_0879]MDQ1231844.1 tryptophan halogenase [Sphingomonas sp. SORGH_AS_0879]